MNKRFNKFLVASVSTMMLGTLFSSNVVAQEERTKYDPSITITIGKQLDENAGRYEPGDDINNNQMTRLTEEILGIKMETVLLGGDADNYTTKLRLALTGTEELPDVFPVYDTQMISDMIESGRARAIDEDIEAHMSDRIKGIYDRFPETFYPIIRDGQTYGIANAPFLEEGQVLFVRQDWLDALGLEAPTNLEEFETVIAAFTENDPDGNGKDDTYGFTYTGIGIYNSGWVSDPVMLFSANSGIHFPGSWQEDENGELMYGSIHEGNRATLEKMAEWHEKGYLFPEAAATGAWDAMSQFIEGKAGMFMGRSWAYSSILDLLNTYPDANVVAYPTLRQSNGDPSYQGGQTNDGWLMFSSEFENTEAFFEYLDWLYDIAFGTGDFQYGFIKGVDWDEVDGEIVLDSKQFNEPIETPFLPGKTTVLKNQPKPEGFLEAYDAVINNGKEPENRMEYDIALSSEQRPEQLNANYVAYSHIDELISSKFNGEPTETMKRNWEQLRTLEMQTYTNIIYGRSDITAFDDFVKQWKEQGGDKITQEVNEWYQTVKQN
ncbi:extracellular solute-binding protein [Fundicoccus sp. Sow4_H7]|uniref:extracellular solute-binding protein n=1 Tax=Fundicoccus sp. Sow4_H7 TaxID=3438784 RepID=UPI003F8E2CF9